MPYLRLDTGHWPIGLSAVRFKEVSARCPDKSAQVDDDFAFALGKFARKQRLPNPGETPRHKQLQLVGLSLRIALGLVVALVGWNCGGAFSARATDQQSINGAAARLSSEVPFQLSAGFLILVEGRVGPMTPLKFILDTGATHTVVDGKLADELSLPRRKGKVLNFDKDLKVDWTNLPELQVGPILARNAPVMVGDLKQFSEFAEGIDAIIGMDLLRSSQSLIIDYRKMVLTFRTSDARGPWTPQDAQALTVQLSVQGQPVHLIIDTGLQSMLLYTDRLHKHMPGVKLTDRIAEVRQGRLRGEKALLSGILFGPDESQASVLLLSKAPDSLPTDIDGYLGLSILHAQIIQLDFASNKLRWQ